MSTEPTPGPHAGMYPTIIRKPRRWPWIVGIVAAFFVGMFIGAAVAVAPDVDAEPEPAVTVTAEPEVVTETVTETVEVGGECRAYAEFVLDGYQRRGGIVMDGIGEMADILDRDGFMIPDEFVTIVDDMTLNIEILTAEIAASNSFDCLEG